MLFFAAGHIPSQPPEEKPGVCPRCGYGGPKVEPWRGWRIVRAVLIAILCLLLCLSPILAVDYVVMTPTSLLIAFALGPVLAFAAVKPTCRKCGYAFTGGKGRALLARRARPLAPARRPLDD